MNRGLLAVLGVAVAIGTGMAIGWATRPPVPPALTDELSTWQITMCGEDAVQFCPSSPGIAHSRSCLMANVLEITQECAYVLRHDLRNKPGQGGRSE